MSVDEIEVVILAGAGGELPGGAGGILQVGQQNGPAGAEIDIVLTFMYPVMHLEIVGDSQTALWWHSWLR